jgi:hypothetical protein
MVKKIISGGQTGADRAALEFAIKHNIPHGGWVPKGRKAENGRIPDIFQLQEMPTDSYRARTEQNVVDSDGTLIVSHGQLIGRSGPAYAAEMARKHSRPWLYLDIAKLSIEQAAQTLRSWIAEHDIEVLNVAGPRQSADPKIYDATFQILRATFP